MSSWGNDDADFAQYASGGIDAGSAMSEVSGSESMERCQNVLIERLYGNRVDILVAERFKQSFGVGAIGFVAHDVGTDSVWWEKDDGVTEAMKLSSPVVGGAAGLEENGGRLAFGKETLEPGTRKTMVFAHVTGMVGDGDLENGFREIDGYGRMGHGGLLLSECEATGRPGTSMMPNAPLEESILSMQRAVLCATPLAVARVAPLVPPLIDALAARTGHVSLPKIPSG
jgi:hypothetical protein